MADLVIPATAVKNQSATPTQGTAAVAIVAGQTVKVDASGNIILATRTENGVAGIAVCSAEIGQPVLYVGGGTLEIEGLMTAGETYTVGAAAGSIAPIGDLVSTNFVNYVGTGKDVNTNDLGILRASGHQKA